MTLVGADPPPSIETLREFQSDGRAWVWTDADDHPVEYIIAAVVDGNQCAWGTRLGPPRLRPSAHRSSADRARDRLGSGAGTSQPSR